GPVRRMAQNQIVGLLSTRLQLERDATSEPAIVEQEIEAPVVGIGLPRTGASLLFELLQLDPESRCPLVWEASFPSPPPDLRNYYDDPRIALSQSQAPNP